MQCLHARLESIVNDGVALPPSKTQKYARSRSPGGDPKDPAGSFSASNLDRLVKPTKSSDKRLEDSVRSPSPTHASPYRGRDATSPSPQIPRPVSAAAIRFKQEKEARLGSSKVSQRLYEAIQGPKVHGSLGPEFGVGSSVGPGGGSSLDDYGILMATEAHKNMTSIGMTEYWAVRSLFTEIDDDCGGWLSLAELLKYQSQHPKRVKKEIFQNLILDPDGRVFFDEFLKIHFPKLPDTAIEALIEQYEPKSQNVEILSAESNQALESLFRRIQEDYPAPNIQLTDATPSNEKSTTLLGMPSQAGAIDPFLEQSVRKQQHSTTEVQTGDAAGAGAADAQSMFSMDDRNGTLFAKGTRSRKRRVSVGGASGQGSAKEKDDRLSDAGTVRNKGTSRPRKQTGAPSVASFDRVSTGSALFKKLKGRSRGGATELEEDVLTLHQIFEAFEKPCRLTVSELIELFKCRGVTELKSSLPSSLFHLELQRRERKNHNNLTPQGQYFVTTAPARPGTSGGTTPNVPFTDFNETPPSLPHPFSNPLSTGTTGLTSSSVPAMAVTTSLGATSQLSENVSELILRLSSIVSGAPKGAEKEGGGNRESHKQMTRSAGSQVDSAMNESSNGAPSSSVAAERQHEREREASQLQQWNTVWLTDPSALFVLNNVFVTMPQFKVLLMEYYVMRQTKMPVELYNPRLKELQAKFQWERLFPYTGPIKGYFKELLPLEPVNL